MEHKQLIRWLIEECNKRNLSFAEASRRAGIAPNSISEIVNGTPAGVKRLTALAQFFDTPLEHVYRMAGLLPTRPSNDDIDPELQRIADELMHRWQRIQDRDRASAERLTSIAMTQVVMVEAAMRAMEQDTRTSMQDESAPDADTTPEPAATDRAD